MKWPKVNKLYTRFRKRAENCTWENADDPIRDQVIDKYRSSEIRQTLLIKETDLTIAKLQEDSRSFETIDIQFYYMALSHEDWELQNSRIWLAKIDIDRGLDFPI